MYPRRLGAGRWEAVPSLRPVTRSARRYEGTEDFKNRVAHISATSRLVSLCWPRLGGVRNGRDALVASVYGTQMLRMRRFGKDRCGYDARNTGLRHNRSLPRCRAGIDGPVHLASTIIRSFPVPLQKMKQRASQPQNQSPCPRASARAVLTGRRPRDVPAPPRRVALGGGPEPPAGQHGARGGTEEIRNGRDALVASDGGRTPTGCGRDKRGPPAVSFTAYHGWTLPCFFSRSCPSPVAFSSALSGRVSSSRTFRSGSSPCRAALS